jgi:hypothetical protein
MNIDERLEALTHSVELLASFHKDNEQRLGQLMEAMTRLGNIDRPRTADRGPRRQVNP